VALLIDGTRLGNTSSRALHQQMVTRERPFPSLFPAVSFDELAPMQNLLEEAPHVPSPLVYLKSLRVIFISVNFPLLRSASPTAVSLLHPRPTTRRNKSRVDGREKCAFEKGRKTFHPRSLAFVLEYRSERKIAAARREKSFAQDSFHVSFSQHQLFVNRSSQFLDTHESNVS
jgi:hypothetical protein